MLSLLVHKTMMKIKFKSFIFFLALMLILSITTSCGKGPFKANKKDMRDTLYDLFNEKRKELTLLPYDKEIEQKLKDIGKSIKLINTSSKQKTICEQIPIILEKKDYKFDSNRPELFCFKNIKYGIPCNITFK